MQDFGQEIHVNAPVPPTRDPVFQPEPSQTVHTVYAFLWLERGVETPSLAPYKATRDAIERVLGARRIDGTAEAVSGAMLDAHGRFVRRATGWGDLDG